MIGLASSSFVLRGRLLFYDFFMFIESLFKVMLDLCFFVLLMVPVM